MLGSSEVGDLVEDCGRGRGAGQVAGFVGAGGKVVLLCVPGGGEMSVFDITGPGELRKGQAVEREILGGESGVAGVK